MSSSPPAKPRPYRRFVVSALHYRFVQTACLSLSWSLVIAFCTSDWHLNLSSVFWALFPLGLPGIKALLFALSSVLVLTSHISTLNIGQRTVPSRLGALRATLLARSSWATLVAYLLSGWWFTEVLVWTSSASNSLGWVIKGGYGAPDQLNERPIYLRFFFLLLALMQASVHIYYDKSSIPIQIQPTASIQKEQARHPDSLHPQQSVWLQLNRDAPKLLSRALSLSAIATMLGPFLYTLFFRSLFWTTHVNVAKVFANITRQDARPPSGFYIGSILLKAFIFGVLLCLSWELSTMLFRANMLQPPTRKGTPLSSLSKDPNGTLINGLAAKRDPVKTFAFWELAIIANCMQDRRKAIFADFDRLTGPALTSIINSALAVISQIDSRIASFSPVPGVPLQTTTTSNPSDSALHSLPKLLPPTRHTNNTIFANAAPVTRSDKISNFVSHEAQQLGQSPTPFSPQELLNKYGPSVLEYTKPTIVDLRERGNAAAQSPLGAFLLPNPARTINSAVLGSPTGNAAIIVDAIDASTKLLVASLQEDNFGKAVSCVPDAVKQFTKTLSSIERFVHLQTGGIGDDKQIPEVVIIHQKLKTALSELISAFRLFLLDMGLGTKEFHEAENACKSHRLLETTARIQNDIESARLESREHHKRPEMEQITSQDSKKPQEEQAPKAAAQNESTSNQPRPRTISTGSRDRPGRLFRHLDDDFVTSNQGRSSGMRAIGQGNVLGARDFGSLPAGGLSRRRVAEVR